MLNTAINIIAVCAAVAAALFAGKVWRIERRRDRNAWRPALSAEYEDYGGDYPHLEITNDADEDLSSVMIELRPPLIGYVPALTALLDEEGNAVQGQTDLGSLKSAETKRVPVQRDDPASQWGEAIVYASCVAPNGLERRVTVKAAIPRRSI